LALKLFLPFRMAHPRSCDTPLHPSIERYIAL
jgi:hypothetical protein